MIRLIPIFSLAIAAFCYCGGNPESTELKTPPLADVLTLELTFGDDESLGDYLLTAEYVEVVDIDVDPDGNMYIADEHRIKVYDPSGTPLALIGGEGDGPGEFGRSSLPSFIISPGGYITHKGTPRYNVFYPDRTLFQSRNWYTGHPVIERHTNNTGLGNSILSSIAAFNDSLCLYFLHFVNFDTDTSTMQIVVAKGDEHSTVISSAGSHRMAVFFPMNEFYEWALLPRERLVLSSSASDVDFDENRSTYTLNIFSLLEDGAQTITRTFVPETYPDSIRHEVISRHERQVESFADAENDRLAASAQENLEHVRKLSKQIQYKTPVRRILADGNSIFVFRTRRNDSDDILTDVFDSRTMSFVVSAWFPFIPAAVNNGYAYRVTQNDQGFEIAEKYRIDPAVYGK